MTTRTPRSSLRAAPQRQQGVVLFVALIALVAMALAAIGLMRSVDTSNVIAGNMAFKQSTINAGDLGVEDAFDKLATIVTTSLEANYPAGCTNACTYYPTLRAPDARGIPTIKEMTAASPSAGAAVNWSSVASVTLPADLVQYEVRYVIDRLCQGPAPVTDVQANCYNEAPQGGGTKKSLGVVFSSTTTVYYRVTVRVLGPRNTLSYVQVVISR
ncbi:MAG: pilus assembly PilX family protein [Candidatus Rokuibacteriota bacterium]